MLLKNFLIRYSSKMEIEEKIRNRKIELEELCPFAKYCVIDYTKCGNCRGRENYTPCIIYQEVIKCKEEYLRDELIAELIIRRNKQNTLEEL